MTSLQKNKQIWSNIRNTIETSTGYKSSYSADFLISTCKRARERKIVLQYENNFLLSHEPVRSFVVIVCVTMDP